jgi:hypothetical protein
MSHPLSKKSMLWTQSRRPGSDTCLYKMMMNLKVWCYVYADGTQPSEELGVAARWGVTLIV